MSELDICGSSIRCSDLRPHSSDVRPPSRKKKAGVVPARRKGGLTCIHIQEVRSETVARSVRAPGGWGAEKSGTRSEPGPEATVGGFAGQLGACLAKIGLHYETL